MRLMELPLAFSSVCKNPKESTVVLNPLAITAIISSTTNESWCYVSLWGTTDDEDIHVGAPKDDVVQLWVLALSEEMDLVNDGEPPLPWVIKLSDLANRATPMKPSLE